MLPLAVKPLIGLLGTVAGEVVAFVRLPSTLVGVAANLSAIREDVRTLDEEVRRMRMGVNEINDSMDTRLTEVSEELASVAGALRPLRRARSRLSGAA
jgi:hypothetical protein